MDTGEEVKVLEGKVEVDYRWNPGPVAGRFLTDLRDNQEFTAIRCTKTSKVYLPPQSWSPYGQIKMERFETINTTPYLRCGTIVYEPPWNKPEGVDVPYMLAAIQFAGADSELIHLVVASEETLKALRPGAELRPVWKEERTGTIRDVAYFEPV